jgi:hypothetical protein
MMQFIYFALIGWCGNEPRPKFVLKKPKLGDPIPNPIEVVADPTRPQPWTDIVAATVGGLAGGYLANWGMGGDMVTSSFGALAGGRIVSDIASRVF